MTTELIIVRHGNTFDKGDVCVRVGLKTDIPLSKSGEEQAKFLGRYLKENNIKPNIIFTSELKRTIQTAEIAFTETNYKNLEIEKLKIFNEIDYGEDEGKTEEQLIERIGEDSLKDWEEKAIVPDGWNFNSEKCIESWRNFAKMLEIKFEDKIVMVFTSNGIARFSPYLTESFDKFAKNFNIKISTGAFSVLEKEKNSQYWSIVEWNKKPKDFVQL